MNTGEKLQISVYEIESSVSSSICGLPNRIARIVHPIRLAFRTNCPISFYHGVPTPMYFEGVLTDGGGANEFISAASRGRSRN